MARQDHGGRRSRRLWWYILAGVALFVLGFWPSRLPSLEWLRVPGPVASPPAPVPGEPPAGRPPAIRPSRGGALLLGNAGQVGRGGVITFEGHQFQPGEVVVLVLLDREATIGQTVVDEGGNFYGLSYAVPEDLPPGQYTVSAVGQTSGREGRASFVYQAGLPWLNATPEALKPGQTLHVRGGGFEPGEQVDLYLDSVAGQPLASMTADAGTLLPLTEVPLPLAPAGDHALVALGTSSQVLARAPIYVIGFAPWIEMTNYTPQAESPFGFTGHDFAPNETVRVFLGIGDNGRPEGEPVAVVRANSQGIVDGEETLQLSADQVGPHTLVAVGSLTQQPVTAEFEVMPFGPGLELTRYAGRVGTEIGFTGSYFAPGETLHAYLGRPGSGREVAVFQADASGAFQAAGRFVLPRDVGDGGVTLTVVGERSKAPVSVEFTVLPLEPGLTLGPSPDGESGPAFRGWGFAAEEPVRLHRGAPGGELLAEATADADGNIQGVLPAGLTGPETAVIAVGERSGGVARLAAASQSAPPASEAPAAPPRQGEDGA